MNIKAAALAVALHALPLLSLLSCAAAQQSKTPKGDPPPPVLYVLAESGGMPGECDNYYIGLGFMSGFDGEVWDVAVNGPAWRAGLRDGDVILNAGDHWPGKYAEGTPVVLRVQGKGELLARVGKVCQA